MPLRHWLFSLSLSWTFGPSSVPECWLCRHVLSIPVSTVLRIYSGLPNTEPNTLLFYSLMDGLKLNPSFLLHCLVCSSQRIDILQVCSTQNYLCPCSQVWQHKRLNRQHAPPPPHVFICSCQAGTLCLIPQPNTHLTGIDLPILSHAPCFSLELKIWSPLTYGGGQDSLQKPYFLPYWGKEKQVTSPEKLLDLLHLSTLAPPWGWSRESIISLLTVKAAFSSTGFWHMRKAVWTLQE